MNEQQEIERLMKRLQTLQKKSNALGDFHDLPFDKWDKYDMILENLEDEMDELQDDYAVTDFLINGSRMTTCPEK
jgi:hypothetical protein